MPPIGIARLATAKEDDGTLGYMVRFEEVV